MRTVLLAVLLAGVAGCFGPPTMLGKPVYEPDAWTVRVATQTDRTGVCDGPFSEAEELKVGEYDFSIQRPEAPCIRLEAARRVTIAGTFDVTLNGSAQDTILELDDRAREHSDGYFGNTTTTNWVQLRPGQQMLLITQSNRAAANSWFSIKWEPTTAPDPAAIPTCATSRCESGP